MTDLLTVNSLSPRLMWLAKHGLVIAPVEKHSWRGNREGNFMCSNRAGTQTAFGIVEVYAELEYCERYGIEHYTVQEWNDHTSIVCEERWD